MAYLELKEDSQFPWICPNDYMLYLLGSMELGKKEGIKYQNQDLEEILKENGVRILYQRGIETSKTVYSMIQSQIYFTEKEKTVEIFMKVIEEKQKLIKKIIKKLGFNITVEDLKQLHLAHEFYHFLEFTQKQPASRRLPPVKKQLWGVIPVCSHVQRTSEIAAHQFAKEVCSFPFHPKFLDYCYQLEKGAYTEESLKALFFRTQEEIKKEDMNAAGFIFGQAD